MSDEEKDRYMRYVNMSRYESELNESIKRAHNWLSK